MTLKRNTPKDPPSERQSIENLSALDSNEIDSSIVNNDSEQNNSMSMLADKVIEQMRKAETDNAMSSVPAGEYDKPHQGVTVTPSSDPKANTGPMSPRQREDMMSRLQARTATDEDLANIDESMVLDLPFIKAADFSIPGQYSPKPLRPDVRFRWVNCVNALQSNMQRFLALGFSLASPDDVDLEKTPLADSMIQGTQIRQYDVVLMKIPVLKLMALYKKNVLDSLYKLDSVQSGRYAQAAAQQTFNDGLSRADSSVINKTRESSGRDPVTFSQT